MKKLLLCLGCALLISLPARSGKGADDKTPAGKKHEEIALWPGVAPGDQGDLGAETSEIPNPKADPSAQVVHLTNVSKPTLTIYKPSADKDTGAAVIVCPGGGYRFLSMKSEGTEICEWLNSIGVTGLLLKYRVPGRGEERFTAPLQDAQRAIGLVRERASSWGIDPKRIGMIGFSAGGHLSAALSNNFEKRLYPTVDEADKQSCRPDFAILIYPGGMVDKADANKLTPEMKISDQTPPTFIAMTLDDHAENALAYCLALKQAKVPAEMHLYPTGGHGYGLRHPDKTVSTWPLRAAEWMQSQGWLKAKAAP